LNPAAKTIPLTLETPSAIHLGAWLTFAESFYLTHGSQSQESASELYSKALRAHPTILYFHGNAATRAVDFRVWLQRTYSTFLNCNVLTIDYRGFGNSTGVPSQPGLIEDAKTSWDWLVRHGAAPKDILIIGQSLGTGVSSQLGALLAQQGSSRAIRVGLVSDRPSFRWTAAKSRGFNWSVPFNRETAGNLSFVRMDSSCWTVGRHPICHG
jgi:abhydrolase domain-containing protein 12